MAQIKLPTRYEDLALEFRGRLKPNRELLEVVKSAYKSMHITGGIRFLPVFGDSGSGKSCAAREIDTHLPNCRVSELPREAIESKDELFSFIDHELTFLPEDNLFIAVIDQYEEAVAERGKIPTQFVETLSLLDRDQSRKRPMLFVWLTTSREFQTTLAGATSRNRRILVAPDFKLAGPPVGEWPQIIEETFEFHNDDRTLADYQILDTDLVRFTKTCSTIGAAISETATHLSEYVDGLQDLSDYQVVMLWPFTDGQRHAHIAAFTNQRTGYKLDWKSLYRELNQEERNQLPLPAYNKARLYFDVRLIPIAAADLQPLCKDLEEEEVEIAKSKLERFAKTHFYYIVNGTWGESNFARLRERASARANDARNWYPTITSLPTQLGRRIAFCLKKLGLDAGYEKSIKSKHATVRADVLIQKPTSSPKQIIVELKLFNTENTYPASIKAAVLTTLKRHAQLAGFVQRQ